MAVLEQWGTSMGRHKRWKTGGKEKAEEGGERD